MCWVQGHSRACADRARTPCSRQSNLSEATVDKRESLRPCKSDCGWGESRVYLQARRYNGFLDALGAGAARDLVPALRVEHIVARLVLAVGHLASVGALRAQHRRLVRYLARALDALEPETPSVRDIHGSQVTMRLKLFGQEKSKQA